MADVQGHAQEENDVRAQIRELRQELKEAQQETRERHHRLRTDIAAISLLTDSQRRTEAALSDHDDRIDAIGRSCETAVGRLDYHKQRLEHLESINTSVLAEQVKDLRGQVRWLIVSFVGMIMSVLSGIIVFLIVQGVG